MLWLIAVLGKLVIFNFEKPLSQLIYAQVSVVSTTYILYTFSYADEKDPL